MLRDQGRFRVDAVAENVAVYRQSLPAGETPGLATPPILIPETRLELLDMPALPNDDPEKAAIRFAASGLAEPWRGAVVYRSGRWRREFRAAA